MKEKILEWAEASEIKVKQVDKICIGGIVTWFVHVNTCMIHKVNFKLAEINGIHIEIIEAITTIDGKFDGFALWINDIKGE